jgi:hypothetical protein
MDTNELIKALAADNSRRGGALPAVWWSAVGLSVVIATIVFLAVLGVRPDIAAATETVRFLFKFVVTMTLAASAFGLVRALSRPGEGWRDAVPYLAVSPLLLAFAVMAELLVLPPDVWSAKAIGSNSLVCLAYIPLIGVGPLAVFLHALRKGAPTRPALAGAAAGLLAGGIAATFYAAHCTDDSPLFVATWYTIAIVGLAIVGAICASRIARW